MRLITFIESRLAEPITAVDINYEYVAFGSISGYFGIFSLKHKTVKYSDKCEDELIRGIKLFGQHMYVLIGDEKILRVTVPDLMLDETMFFDDFRHNDGFCPNVFTMVGVDAYDDQLNTLLMYFPTPDTEKLSKFKRVGDGEPQ